MVTLFSGENYEKNHFRAIFGPSKFQKWHFLRFVVDWWVWRWPTHQSVKNYDNPFGIFGNLISKCTCMSEIFTPSNVSGMSHRQRTKLKLFINSRGTPCIIICIFQVIALKLFKAKVWHIYPDISLLLIFYDESKFEVHF